MALLLIGLLDGYLGNYKRSWRWLAGLSGNYCFDRMAKDGWVVRGEDQDDNVALLEDGRKKLLEKFPLLELRKLPWDGKWRVVMYDLPEKIRRKRNNLRRWLKRLGFGQWQLSVWVSPHPVVDRLAHELEKVGLLEYCSIHESRRMVGVDDREFADRIWGITALNKKYEEMEKQAGRGNLEKMIEVLMVDPLLPKELLPDNWRWDSLLEKVIGKN